MLRPVLAAVLMALLFDTIALAQGNLCEPAFRKPVAYSTGVTPCALTTGDVDLDGHVDLIVANCSSLDVSVLFGVGDGTFEPAHTLSLGVTPGDVTVGDIDEDGNPDIAICARNYSYLLVCWGEGNRAFTSPTILGSPPSPSRLRVADIDEDSHLDFVMNGDLKGVAVIWGDGSRTPPDHTIYALPAAVFALQVVDLNLDGRGDLTASSCADSSLFVLWNLGSRSFSSPTTALSAPQAYLCDCSFGSLGGSGALDVTCVDANSYLGRIKVALGDGAGGFESLRTIGVGLIPLDAAVADLDRDSVDDIAVTNSGSADVSIVNGINLEVSETLVTGPCPSWIQARDLNGDEWNDLVVLDECAGYVQVYLSWGGEVLGSVNFSPTPYSAGTGTDLTATLSFSEALSAPVDAMHVRISESGRQLGDATSLEVLDGGTRITAVFEGDVLNGLSTGVHQLEIHGCDSQMRAFGAISTLEVAKASFAVRWASVPGRTPIALQLDGAQGRTEVRIFSSAGLLVRSGTVGPGSKSYVWDGLSSSGASVASGIYLVRASNGGLSGACKVVLLR